MRMIIQILDAPLETLETSNNRFHNLGYQVECCLEDVNYTHNSNIQRKFPIFNSTAEMFPWGKSDMLQIPNAKFLLSKINTNVFFNTY